MVHGAGKILFHYLNRSPIRRHDTSCVFAEAQVPGSGMLRQNEGRRVNLALTSGCYANRPIIVILNNIAPNISWQTTSVLTHTVSANPAKVGLRAIGLRSSR